VPSAAERGEPPSPAAAAGGGGTTGESARGGCAGVAPPTWWPSSGSTRTAVPYAQISAHAVLISRLSNRMPMTALAPFLRASSTIALIASVRHWARSWPRCGLSCPSIVRMPSVNALLSRAIEPTTCPMTEVMR